MLTHPVSKIIKQSSKKNTEGNQELLTLEFVE